ncbi:MAG: UDP-N-acetylmuramoyl-L-alanine--D-glutamate ligase [Planctomycetota bacterium]
MFSPITQPMSWFQEKRVTVMGLGSFGGGVGVAEFLCRAGAYVTVTDLKSEEVLKSSVEKLKDRPIRWVLGEHREEDFLEADLVVASPAIPRSAPLIKLCAEKKVPLETEMNLFFKYCRGRICAVTGSNGKTTTTSLLAEMAKKRWPNLRSGGNMGRSLLPEVSQIKDDEWVVLELSSFQLDDLASIDRRPEISIVTNVSPNHLDRHGDYLSYLEAKRRILEPPGERPGSRDATRGIAIINGDDAGLRDWAGWTKRAVWYFGQTSSVVPSARGVWVDVTMERGEEAVFRSQGSERVPLFSGSDLQLRGRFNLLNAAGASAAASCMGVEPKEILEALREFRPVSHRLELFHVDSGIEFFDDSIATTPESSIAALEALGPKVHLICGGSSKGCSFDTLAEAIRRKAKCVYLIGSTATEIEDALLARPEAPPIDRAQNLKTAVATAKSVAQPGDRILLSPACPSYDQFENFVERGEEFKRMVRELSGAPA